MSTQVMEMKNPGAAVDRAARIVLRYGLVLVLAWIGAMKFTAYEAEGIKGLVATSPLMSWLYKVLSLQATSNLIGVTELCAATLIAIRPWLPKLSVIGSVLAVCTFLSTLSFLFSLPGWEKSLGGFLLKDVVLMGAALWTLGDSWAAAKR